MTATTPLRFLFDPLLKVYHAVFDRSIPKLLEILLMPNIESFKYRDALITLNEMVDHQEMKDQMITQGTKPANFEASFPFQVPTCTTRSLTLGSKQSYCSAALSPFKEAVNC